MTADVLNIPALRVALDRVLHEVEREHGETVALEHDHYWHLDVESAFDLTSEPSSLTVGQVSDDLAEMSQHDPDDYRPAWHSLPHAIGLLRMLELVSRP